MKHCPVCNSTVSEQDRFCLFCGTEFAAEPTSAPTEVLDARLCPNCSSKAEGDGEFCVFCGASLLPGSVSSPSPAAFEESLSVCAYCAAPRDPNSAFCLNCGASFETLAVPTEEEAKKGKKKKQKKEKKPLSRGKKALLITTVSLGLVAVILAGVFLIPLLFAKPKINSVLYIKDGELYFSSLKKVAPYRVTDDFSEKHEEYGYTLYGSAVLSEDGKCLFYYDDVAQDFLEKGHTLYWCETGDKNAEREEIASEVLSFHVNSSADRVTYLAGEERTLYRWDFDEAQEIADKIKTFRATSDGSTLLYLTEENELYRKTGEEDAEKLAEEVESIWCLYDSGEAYYTVRETRSFPLHAYVTDDKKEEDAALVCPTEPTRPHYNNYPTAAEYEAAYQAWLKEQQTYDEQLPLWEEKVARDLWRETLATEEYVAETETLCFFDGEESRTVAENVLHAPDTAAKSPVIALAAYYSAEVSMPALSELSSVEEIYRKIEECEFSKTKIFIAACDSLKKISDDYTIVSIDASGTRFCFIGEERKLFVGEIANGTEISDPERIDKDVAHACCCNGRVVYLKNSGEDGGDLYLDEERIDRNVALFSYQMSEDGGLYYIKGMDKEGAGTLCRYKNGKSEKLAKDVHDWYLAPSGELVYLANYDTEDEEGTLYLYKEKEPVRIDRGVSRLIWPSNQYA